LISEKAGAIWPLINATATSCLDRTYCFRDKYACICLCVFIWPKSRATNLLHMMVWNLKVWADPDKHKLNTLDKKTIVAVRNGVAQTPLGLLRFVVDLLFNGVDLPLNHLMLIMP